MGVPRIRWLEERASVAQENEEGVEDFAFPRSDRNLAPEGT